MSIITLCYTTLYYSTVISVTILIFLPKASKDLKFIIYKLTLRGCQKIEKSETIYFYFQSNSCEINQEIKVQFPISSDQLTVGVVVSTLSDQEGLLPLHTNTNTKLF